LTQAACRYFNQCDGVDLAPSMLDLARELNQFGEDCRYWLNTASDLALFENDSFDFVFSFLVLQHMPRPYSERYIAEFMRVLRPNGIAMFQLPADFVADPDERSGSRTALMHPVRADLLSAEIALVDPPPSLLEVEPGAQIKLRAKVKNSGEMVWPAMGDNHGNFQIKVAHDWVAHDGSSPRAGSSTTLSADLPPGAETEVPVLVYAPGRSGFYSLFIEVEQEGVAREESSSRGAKVAVNVGEPNREPASDESPPIHMHGIPKPRVVELLRNHGAHILDIRVDEDAGGEWTSFTYFAAKSLDPLS
jgi:SAM-dependent methyltransferase